MSSSSSAGGGEKWAWLGLLKWTLAHQDGTVPSEESPTMMSDEDKAFLEKVMAEGIIDECDRMKFILQQFSNAMEYYKNRSERMMVLFKKKSNSNNNKKKRKNFHHRMKMI